MITIASKKFSRLSIMLEARDRMSDKLQKAANATDKLSGKMNDFSSKLRKGRNATKSLEDGTNNLSDKYKKLMFVTNGLETNMSRVQRRLEEARTPTSKLAVAYNVLSTATANMIAKSKFLSTTLKVTTSILKIFAATAGVAASALYLIGKGAYTISGLSKVVKIASNAVKGLNRELKLQASYLVAGAKNTKTYQVMRTWVKAAATSMKELQFQTKMQLKYSQQLVKQTKGYQALNNAVKRIRTSAQATYLSFKLWSNSSRTVDKMKSSLSSLTGMLKRTKTSTQQVNTEMEKLSKRRSTFNDLATANSRLNTQVSRLQRQLQSANGQLRGMAGSLRGLNGISVAFTLAYTGQYVIDVIGNVTELTVGKAMQQNYDTNSVGILAGDENGEAFYKKIQDYASATAYSTEDWARNMRGAIMKSENVKDLEKYMTVYEQLAMLDPVQGLDGAALAVRELNSGDSQSLVERFELPRSALKDIKAIEDPIEQIEALSKMIGENTGYTVDNLDKMKELPLMQWQKLTNSVKTLMGYIGTGAMEKLAPVIENINAAIAAGDMDGWVERIGTGLANMVQGLINVGSYIIENWPAITEAFSPFTEAVQTIGGWIVENWPLITELFSGFFTILGLITDTFMNNWPIIGETLSLVLEGATAMAEYIIENWPQIAPIIMGVATAWGVYRTVTTLAAVAQRLLNAAMKANVILLIVSLIVGLVVWLIEVAMRSEKFREFLKKLWEFMKAYFAVAVENVKGQIEAMGDAFKVAADFVQGLWDKFMGFVEDAKNTTINWGAILPGGESFVDWGGNGHHGGLETVPYDGYQARLHKGERVLTRSEAKMLDAGKLGGGGGNVTVTGNVFHVRDNNDIDKIADALYYKLSEANR